MKTNNEFKLEFSNRIKTFAIEIIKLSNMSPPSLASGEIFRQIIRSSCSIGANFVEAQDASSRKDFFHKISISLREARETKYWLEILDKAKLISSQKVPKLLVEINEIISILVSISKKNEK